MPVGVHLQDARQQLFEAAERVLLRDGPSGLTSRAVTDEAGCAKGVLHRHFADFDTFLAELVMDRADRLNHRAEALRASVGEDTVVENLTRALVDLFGPVPVAIVPLITFRDALRAKLRAARPGGGIAILSETTNAIAAYLTAERDQGRVGAGVDIDALTLSLVGGGHLLFADRDRARPTAAAVERFVAATVRDAVVRPELRRRAPATNDRSWGMMAGMTTSAGRRRHLATSPFQPDPEPDIEEFAMDDLVSHDSYGMGRVIQVEATAVTVDFGSQTVRVPSPFYKMSRI